MTQDEADRLLVEWQHRLRLQDWIVTVQMAPQHQVPGSWAETNRNITHKKAIIRIASNPSLDDPVNAVLPEDFEETLVHELLHLTFCDFDLTDQDRADKLQKRAQEQAINLVAMALVQAKRGNGHAVERAMRQTVPTAERIQEIRETIKTAVKE